MYCVTDFPCRELEAVGKTLSEVTHPVMSVSINLIAAFINDRSF